MAKNNRHDPPDEGGLPQNFEAERRVLDYYIAGGAWREDVTARDFAGERHQTIWHGVKAIHDAGDAIDRPRLAVELGEKKLKRVDGLSYLADLGVGCFPEMNIGPYVEKLRDATAKRDMLNHANIITTHIYSGDRSADELIEMGAQAFAGLKKARSAPDGEPQVLTYADLRQVTPSMRPLIFDDYPLPARGAVLKTGSPKAGKTILAVQEALAVARGKHLFDWFQIRKPGPVLIVEHDDTAGKVTISDIVERSGGGPEGMPFLTVERLPFTFGSSALAEWLDRQITEQKLVMVVLDSYTALRGPRGTGTDLVKAEQAELAQIDEIGKRLECCVQVIHHDSTGKAGRGLEWTQSAAGSFAMSGATEAQVQISRFADLDIKAPERLVRIRGRHAADMHLVLRFRHETQDYEFVLENSAAELYPLVKQIHAQYGDKPFSHQDLAEITGMTRPTVFRRMDRLRQANLLVKSQYGGYRLASDLRL